MQSNKNNQANGMTYLIGGAVLLVILTGGMALPFLIVGYIIYMVIKNKKNPGKGKRTPLSSAQKSEYREQPPRPRPPQTPQNRPQNATPRPEASSMESPNYANDRNRFVRVTTDYGARHRENAKRLLDAGLMERDEYNMQIARSRTL